MRAEAFVEALLHLINTTVALTGSALDDISSLNPTDVHYRGWWTISLLKELGHTISVDAIADFRDRCLSIQKALEVLKPKPLKTMLASLGVREPVVRTLGTFQLLALLCQACAIPTKHATSLNDAALLLNPDTKLAQLQPLFALNQLRVEKAHATGGESRDDPFAVFGIDLNRTVGGWGFAVDIVDDKMIATLTFLYQAFQCAISGGNLIADDRLTPSGRIERES